MKRRNKSDSFNPNYYKDEQYRKRFIDQRFKELELKERASKFRYN